MNGLQVPMNLQVAQLRRSPDHDFFWRAALELCVYKRCATLAPQARADSLMSGVLGTAPGDPEIHNKAGLGFRV